MIDGSVFRTMKSRCCWIASVATAVWMTRVSGSRAICLVVLLLDPGARGGLRISRLRRAVRADLYGYVDRLSACVGDWNLMRLSALFDLLEPHGFY